MPVRARFVSNRTTPRLALDGFSVTTIGCPMGVTVVPAAMGARTGGAAEPRPLLVWVGDDRCTVAHNGPRIALAGLEAGGGHHDRGAQRRGPVPARRRRPPGPLPRPRLPA